MVQKTFDIEELKDPWGGKMKAYRVQHDISGEVFGETNSHFTAQKICEENAGSKIINQWSEKNTKLLFGV